MKKDRNYQNLGKIWKKGRPQNRRPPCFSPGCANRSIKSHLLKQNGIINEFCNHKNEVWQLRSSWHSKSKYYSLLKTGRNNAMSFYGYCSSCDNKIFKPIENPAPKIPSSISEACLYSLRPVLLEIRKKEGNLLYLEQRDKYKKNNYPELSAYNYTIRGINLLKSIYMKLLHNNENNSKFKYVIRELPKIDLCVSSILIRPIYKIVKVKNLKRQLANFEEINANSFNIINLFPLGNKTILLSLTHKNAKSDAHEFQEFVETTDINKLGLSISNMIIAQVEDWCLSDELKNKLPYDFEYIVTYAKLNPQKMFNQNFGINFFNI